jgi:biotin operon repressor
VNRARIQRAILAIRNRGWSLFVHQTRFYRLDAIPRSEGRRTEYDLAGT